MQKLILALPPNMPLEVKRVEGSEVRFQMVNIRPSGRRGPRQDDRRRRLTHDIVRGLRSVSQETWTEETVLEVAEVLDVAPETIWNAVHYVTYRNVE